MAGMFPAGVEGLQLWLQPVGGGHGQAGAGLEPGQARRAVSLGIAPETRPRGPQAGSSRNSPPGTAGNNQRSALRSVFSEVK